MKGELARRVWPGTTRLLGTHHRPGEEVKWNLSRARVMEEKTACVSIREEAREERQRYYGACS